VLAFDEVLGRFDRFFLGFGVGMEGFVGTGFVGSCYSTFGSHYCPFLLDYSYPSILGWNCLTNLDSSYPLDYSCLLVGNTLGLDDCNRHY